MSIDHVTLIPREPDERQPGFMRQTNRKAGRRRNRRHETHTDSRALLNHLKTRTTSDHDKALTKGHRLTGQGPDELVEGIMPPHILAHRDNPLPWQHKSRRMHSTGQLIDTLGLFNPEERF